MFQSKTLRSTLCQLAIYLIVSISAAASAAEPALVAPTEALTAAEQLKQFHLPPGFKIELIAAEPECRKPMNIKFDAAGRLFYTQSIEYPFPVSGGTTGRDTIKVMTDTNGDGLPDQTETYVDGLNIPIGITPIPGGVLGYSIPTLCYYPADASGLRATGRTEFYGEFGFRDTHGMCSSLNYWMDGWVYGCHGFANESKVTGRDGRPVMMQSGNTYRLRPDGSHIEYYTHGQVNPFGLCHDPYGNVYTSDCHTRPAYQLIRGAYYPSFGKPDDGLGFGPEMMTHAHGSSGIAGIIYYDAAHFPAEFAANLFIGNPVTGRINRDTLAWQGATPKAIEQPDFLWCDDPWFRPVDLQLAPDGSIYIADFYNRIIGHYEVPLTHPGRDRERGRIWRVSYVGTGTGTPAPKPQPLPNLATAPIAQVITALGDRNLVVRNFAVQQAVHRLGAAAIEPLQNLLRQSTNPDQQVAAAWALERLGAFAEHRLPLANLANPAEVLRVHELKMLADRSSWNPAELTHVLTQLIAGSPRIRKAAAEAVGQHPQDAAADRLDIEQGLLRAWREADQQDEVLAHACKIALRDTVQVRSSFPKLIAAAGLNAEDLGRLQQIALGIPRADAAAFLVESYPRRSWFTGDVERLAQHAARYLDPAGLPTLDALAADWRKGVDLATQSRAYAATFRGLQQASRPRSEGLEQLAVAVAYDLLGASQPDLQRLGAEFVRDQRISGAGEALVRWYQSPTGQLALALEGLAAIDHPQVVEFAASSLRREDLSLEAKQPIITLLGRLNRDSSRAFLIDLLKAAPTNLAFLIGRELATSPAGGEALLTNIEAGKSSARLLLDQTIDQRLTAAKVNDLNSRKQRLLEGLPAVDQRLVELINVRRGAVLQGGGDALRGHELFKKNCAGCHRLQNQGGKVGPDLDGVGLRGLERLLEDTLDPSRNVDAAFRATVVALKDGKVLSGLALREEGAVLILADEQGREVRVPLDTIDERQQVKLSPMPANVGEKLSDAEYRDLLTFLLAQRTGKPAEGDTR